MCVVILCFILLLILFFLAKDIYTKIKHFNFKQLRIYSKEVWNWLYRGKDAFGCVFVIVASVVICWMFGWNNKIFTVTGCTLELAGIAQGVISLLGVREYFNLPSLMNIFKKWIQERPRFKRSSTTVTASGHVSIGVIVTASGTVFPGEIDTDKPLDEVIIRIAENMKILSELAQKNCSEHSSFDSRINALQSDTTRKIDKTKTDSKKELEQIHTGDFTPAFVGLIWIASGTIMAAVGSIL